MQQATGCAAQHTTPLRHVRRGAIPRADRVRWGWCAGAAPLKADEAGVLRVLQHVRKRHFEPSRSECEPAPPHALAQSRSGCGSGVHSSAGEKSISRAAGSNRTCAATMSAEPRWQIGPCHADRICERHCSGSPCIRSASKNRCRLYLHACSRSPLNGTRARARAPKCCPLHNPTLRCRLGLEPHCPCQPLH